MSSVLYCYQCLNQNTTLRPLWILPMVPVIDCTVSLEIKSSYPGMHLNKLTWYAYATLSEKQPWKSKPWWRHQMGTFSALLAPCEGNPSATGEFPSQRPVTQSFDAFFDLRLNKRLSKQSSRRWFETSLRSLWRHCNDNNVLWFKRRHAQRCGLFQAATLWNQTRQYIPNEENTCFLDITWATVS